MRRERLCSLRAGLEAGDLSAEFLVRASFERMTRLEPALNALVHRDAERSLTLARSADRALRQGGGGPLRGLPFVVKDNLDWAGAPTRNGSRLCGDYTPARNATVVERLIQAGAIPVAKANMDEFAMGSSGEYSAFGPARNPWDLGRSPGGSSSGSVVAVAAGYAPFALGSDTGGSVRLPAAFCGLTALRPTYGILSRRGLTAMANSLDQVGPVARSAEDVALVLSVLAGRDPLDPTSLDLPGAERLAPLSPTDLRGLRLGLPKEYFGPGLEAGTRARLEAAIQHFANRGAELVELSLPHTELALDAYYLINTSEVSSNLARFDGVRYGARKPGDSLQELIAGSRDAGFGMEAKRRILLGAFGLSKGHFEAFYRKALQARRLIAEDFRKAFERVDLIAAPVSPGVAFPLGSRTQDPLSMYLADIFTVTAALASLPALAFPIGLDEGLPTGIQLIGPPLADVKVLETAHAFQMETDHHHLVSPFIQEQLHGL